MYLSVCLCVYFHEETITIMKEIITRHFQQKHINSYWSFLSKNLYMI